MLSLIILCLLSILDLFSQLYLYTNYKYNVLYRYSKAIYTKMTTSRLSLDIVWSWKIAFEGVEYTYIQPPRKYKVSTYLL